MSQRPVYSQGFIYCSATTPNLSFDVPNGFTAVVRQITLSQPDLSADWAMVIANEAGGPEIVAAAGTLSGVFNSDYRELRVVVPGGGFIGINMYDLGEEPNVYVGGYLLTAG